ncbi:rRNA methyltransferase 2, mitochondrial [Orussus abietinus]|uniref:rRNA methyltransferase 2, mitochondrial n=1 Tax=Orussus abietinus TaxID=222816 RepID=UPI0006269181|nr:rRNA methyltransferase 2, mitochondrial [Orussus abietinus]
MGVLHETLINVRLMHTCSVLLRRNLKTVKGKSHSSQLWLERQMRDPYVELAKQENYRCRSAFKLLEVNEKFRIFTPGQVVVDCGAAPGSWTQVAVKLTNADGKDPDVPIGSVIAIDKLPMHPIEGARILGGCDFMAKESQDKLHAVLGDKPVNLVLSDMAPNATGVKELDHDGITSLAYAALKFALEMSHPDATFLVKLWDGGQSQQLENDISRFYNNIRVIRPMATRSESSEKFILARGFKGLKT